MRCFQADSNKGFRHGYWCCQPESISWYGIVKLSFCNIVKGQANYKLNTFLIWFLGDCKLTEWGPWSKCASCGNPAQTTRTRNIIVKPENGGKPCEKLDDTRDCNNPPCPGRQIAYVFKRFYQLSEGIMQFWYALTIKTSMQVWQIVNFLGLIISLVSSFSYNL